MELIKTVTALISSSRILRKRCAVALSQCILCQGDCHTMPLLCQFCLDDLPYLSKKYGNKSTQLNLLLIPKINKNISHQYIEDVYCLTAYEWPMNTWITQLKFQHDFELAKLIANIIDLNYSSLLRQYKLSDATLINMPIHLSRWQKRGFNQSHLIAEQLASSSGIDYQAELIIREKNTESQIGKKGAERRKNIKGAFKIISAKALPAHIIIIDDVITTGTSANELARVLKQAGVQKITLITAALALEKV